jgi:hypothetical protein
MLPHTIPGRLNNRLTPSLDPFPWQTPAICIISSPVLLLFLLLPPCCFRFPFRNPLIVRNPLVGRSRGDESPYAEPGTGPDDRLFLPYLIISFFSRFRTGNDAIEIRGTIVLAWIATEAREVEAEKGLEVYRLRPTGDGVSDTRHGARKIKKNIIKQTNALLRVVLV